MKIQQAYEIGHGNVLRKLGITSTSKFKFGK